MITKEKAMQLLQEYYKDERNTYPLANVFSNAPLALMQTELRAKIHTLELILQLPLSNFPLKK